VGQQADKLCHPIRRITQFARSEDQRSAARGNLSVGSQAGLDTFAL